MPLKKEDVAKILSLLRTKYRECLFIERVLDTEEPLPLAECYINLALIREDEARETKALCLEQSVATTEIFKDERLCSYEEIYEVKEPIAPERIFEQEGETKNPRQVLILGRAGIGKTILCRKLAYEWAKEGSQFWQDKVVFFMQLRELLDHDISSIPSIVRNFCLSADISGKPSEEIILEYLKTNRDKCIWILDGYDEIAEQAEDSKVKQVWRDFFETISKCGRLIITSRPHAIKQQLAGKVFKFERRLENMGFTSENIIAYVYNFVKPETEAKKLLEFLLTNRGLWGIAHIPINLDLICSIGQERLGTDLTLTKLYQRLVNSLVVRHKKTVKLRKETEEQIYNSLYALAYRALRDGKIIIDEDNQSRYLQGGGVSIQELHQTGLIKATSSRAIYFIHLTFQEFCAAKYIANQIISSDSQKQTLLKFIQNEKYDPRYIMVFWFVAGNLYEYWKQSLSRGEEYQLPLTDFFTTIQQFPRDLLGIHHAALLIRLLDECEANEGLKDYESLIQYILPYVRMSVEYGFADKSLISETLTISPNIIRGKAIIDIMLANLHHSNIWIQHQVVAFLLFIGNPEAIAGLLVALHNEDSIICFQAAEALLKLGLRNPEVITGLLSIFCDDNPVFHFQRKYLIELGRSIPEVRAGLQVALDDKNPHVRFQAAKVLIKLEPRNPKAITSLLAALHNEDTRIRFQTIGTLIKLERENPKVIDNLLAALHDENPYIRSRIIEVLGKLERGNPKIITSLLAALCDEASNVRSQAAKALGNLGQRKSKVITSLLAALCDEASNVRSQAAKALGNLGQRNPKVITSLLAALCDEALNVRLHAVEALINLGQKKPKIIDSLLAALRDEHPSVRFHVVTALRNLGQESPEVTTALLAALHDENPHVRLQVVTALVELEQESPAATTALLAALHDENPHVRFQAVTALVELGQESPEVTTALLAALHDKNPYILLDVEKILVNLGRKNQQIIPGLLEALRDEDSIVRSRIVEILVQLEQESVEMIPALLEALRIKDSRVPMLLIKALVTLGQKNQQIIPGLLEALRDKDSIVRFRIVEILVQLGLKTPEVIDSLIALLHDKDPMVRWLSITTLVKFGPESPEVLSNLLEALHDEDSNVHSQAAYALINLGQENPKIIATLVTALRDENPRVRFQTINILIKLGHERLEVIHGLLEASYSKDSDVRILALRALEKVNILSSLLHSNNPQLLESIRKLIQDQQLPTIVLDDYIKLLKGDQTMIESSVHQSDDGAATSSAAAIFPQSRSEDMVFSLRKKLPELNGRLLPEHFGSFSPPEWSLEGMDGLEQLNEIPQRSLAIFLESLSNPSEPNRIQLAQEALVTYPDLSIVKDRYGNTLLHFCALLGDIELANLLLDGSVTTAIDEKNNEGFTPLHFAVYNGKEDIVKYFISKGTNVALRVQIDLKRKPENALCECNSLHLAILGGQLNMIDCLLKAYPSIELLETSFGTILHLAILCGQNQSLKKLLHYPRIRELCNQRQGNEYTPLDLAANIGNIGAIEILCEFGRESHNTVDLIDRSNPKGQTPLHYAVLATQVEAVKRLASYYQLPDLSRQLIGEGRFTALQLAEKKKKEIQKQSKVAGQDKELLKIIWTSYREICTFLDNVQKQKEARQYTMPDFTQIRVRNLVFRGGGPKGIAYIGALSALSEELKKAHRSLEGQESREFLPDVKRVGGTSAGAIIALLVALNFDPTEIEEVLASLDLTSFLDGIDLQALARQGQSMLSQLKEQKGLLGKIINGLKLVWRMAQTRPGQSFWSFLRPDRQFKELFDQLYNFEGLCSGEAFKRKIEEVILNKLTKDKVTIKQDGKSIPFTGNLTFGLLKKLIASGKYGYKHLYIVTTRLGSDEKNPPKIEIFNTEESDISDSVSVSDAVRASMSIPGVFKPHEITINVPGSGIVTHKYVDGGLIQNYPITIFDRAKYVITHFYGHQNRDYPYFNEETLGFSLHTKAHYYLASVEQETQLKDIKLQGGKIIVRVGRPERYSYYCCERTALGLLEGHFQLSVPETSDLYNRLPFPDIGVAPILLPNDSEFMDGIFESILYTNRQGQSSSVISLIREVINVYSHAERLMADLRSCDEHRTISIDDCGVMTTDFGLDTKSKEALRDSGRDTVVEFFRRFNPTYRRSSAPETTSAPAPSPSAALPVATVAESRPHSKAHSPHSYFWAYCNDPTHAPWHGERGHRSQRHAQRELDQEHQGHKESRVVATKTKTWSAI